MKINKLFLLASSLFLLGGCAGEFDGVTYDQDKEAPKITYVNPSESSKEFTVGDEAYVITYDIGGRNGVTNKKVRLSSDDLDVATIEATTVDQNPYAVKVAPVGPGETNVYITSENNPAVKATIKVKVNELPADAGIISLKVPAKTELNIGESVDVEVNETNGNVVWSVEYGYDYFELSNESNSKVTVTGRNAGTANVRATVNGAYAVQSITVKPEPVDKTIYFVNFITIWNDIKFVPTGGSPIAGTPEGYDEFGHAIYSFDMHGSQYESFRVSHNSGIYIDHLFKCSDFVHKNGIKNNPGSDVIELINFTAPVPSVTFGDDTFSIINGYTDKIHVSSYLGNVEYSILSGSDKVAITKQENDGVTIKANAVGTAEIKAKIVGVTPEIYDTIEVTVRPRPFPTVDFEDVPANISVQAEDSVTYPYSVTYTLGTEEVICPVTWEITSGGSFASVTSTNTSVSVTGLAVGSATLRATYGVDSDETTRTFNITVTPTITNTIYFTNNNNWKDVYVYAWKEGSEVKNHAWPGVRIETEPVYNSGFQECYTFTYKPNLYDYVIFNNGASTPEQTDNIPLSGFATKNNVYIKGDSKKENGTWDFDFANFNAYVGSTTTVYLNALYNWNTDDAKIFVHCFKSSTDSHSVLMHWLSNDIYYAKIPTGYNGIVFVRNAPYINNMIWSGDGYWGQTGDTTYNAATPQYNLTSYNSGTWVARA